MKLSRSTQWMIATAFFYVTVAEAQQSQYFLERDNYKYNLAENLYQTKVFNTSQTEYAKQYFFNQQLSRSKKEASLFFDNLIGVILQKKYAEQGLEAFMKEYPKSTYFSQAGMPLVDYYLMSKNYDKALQALGRINQNSLTRDENGQYILKMGYAKYMMGDTVGAVEALSEAYNSVEGNYKKDVAYMLGHLYYVEKDNANAFKYFDTIRSDAKYQSMVQPYYVQMYFNDKNYDLAIQEGKSLLNTSINEGYRDEVNKIIGESYFQKKEYREAYPYLKKYIDQQVTPSENDLYEMGFVAAQMKNYSEAISYYNQIINNQSPLSQNAYYQLGNAYLSEKKKQEALSAFRSAYQMDFDAEIKSLAHEQYAKLSYDIGNPYESPSKVLQNYIKKYPNSSKISEMNQLLVKSYVYSGNYQETLKAIDELPNSSPEINKIDQEVSFLLGTDEFNKGNYEAAEKYFMRSLELNESVETKNRATYWLAQTYYQLGNYPSAIVRYERLLNEKFTEKQQLPYDLGYAYFKAKKFDEAKKYFQDYLKNPKAEYKTDAELRLADTYYANNELNEAIQIYDKVGDTDDYTIYQKALALGFKGDTEAKISNLKNLIKKYPNSEYLDDAYYEMGTAYAAQEDYKNSTASFEQVISKSTDKDLVAQAQIFRAQNYIDLGDTKKAKAEFDALVSKYQNTAYASKIVQAAKPLFISEGDVAGYNAFASKLGVHVNASDLDEINLTTAQNYFAKKDYKNAISFYEKYLLQNPVGDNLYQAKYEMGESLYQTKNTTKALLVLQDVASSVNDYQDDARMRIAQIFLSQDNKADAKTYLAPIINSSDASIRNFASVELMKLYAEEKSFDKAEKLADTILSNDKISASVKESAKVVKARILSTKGKDKEAEAAFASLEKSANTEVAAEAIYMKAFYLNKAKSYKASNDVIFQLAKKYASEEYWGAKALVLMAKNYFGLKDNYQASYTCDQIIANYSDFPDIVSEAKEVKKQIKK